MQYAPSEPGIYPQVMHQCNFVIEPSQAHLWDFLSDSDNRQAVATAGPPPARKKAPDDQEGFEDEELHYWKLGVGPADTSGYPIVYEGRLFSVHIRTEIVCAALLTHAGNIVTNNVVKSSGCFGLLARLVYTPDVNVGIIAVVTFINTKSQDRKNAMLVLRHSVAPSSK